MNRVSVWVKLTAFAVVSSCLFGCAAVARDDTRAIHKDLSLIKYQLRNLDPKKIGAEASRFSKGLKKEMEEIKDRLEVIKDVEVIRKNQADLKSNQEELVSEIIKINEKIDELKHFINKGKKKGYTALGDDIKNLSALFKQTAMEIIKLEEHGNNATKNDLTSLNVKISQLPEFYRINAAEESRKKMLLLNSISVKIDSLDSKLMEFFDLYKTVTIKKMKGKKKKSASPSKKR